MTEPTITEMLQLVDEIVSIGTAFAALYAMWHVGRQEWRSPVNMWSRRVVLGVLSGVAMCHALTPSIVPEVLEQMALAVLVVLMATAKSPDAQRRRW